MSFNQRLEGLANGTYDVVAYGIPATSELKDSLLLTSPIILSKQVLVQRKVGENDSLAIRSQLDLAGKTLNVVKGSPSILRIRNLSNDIGDTISRPTRQPEYMAIRLPKKRRIPVRLSQILRETITGFLPSSRLF